MQKNIEYFHNHQLNRRIILEKAERIVNEVGVLVSKWSEICVLWGGMKKKRFFYEKQKRKHRIEYTLCLRYSKRLCNILKTTPHALANLRLICNEEILYPVSCSIKAYGKKLLEIRAFTM